MNQCRRQLLSIQITFVNPNLVVPTGFEPVRFLQNGFTDRRFQPLTQVTKFISTYRVQDSNLCRIRKGVAN